MKSQTALIALIIAAFVLTVIQGCSPGTEADHLQANSNLEQSVQQVRVVLLRVGPNKSMKGQPEFVVTFGIEISKKGAFSDLLIDSNEVTLAVGGKPVVFHGGTEEASTGFEGLPRRSELSKPVVGEGKAMLFEDVVFKTLQIDAKQVDLKVQFSWRKIPMRFDFKDVPVGYQYRSVDSSLSR